MEKFDFYKLAIDARDKLNENYHKWMTFYYVANGAILVALISISAKEIESTLLAVIGLLISIFWNLSCKGYYYWSKSWIEILIKHEKELISSQQENIVGVYSSFSEKINNTKSNIFNPTGFANISTPKLTLLFSFIVIMCWLIFIEYTFLTCFESINLFYKIFISLLILLLTFGLYGYIIPKWTKSRNEDEELHNLI